MQKSALFVKGVRHEIAPFFYRWIVDRTEGSHLCFKGHEIHAFGHNYKERTERRMLTNIELEKTSSRNSYAFEDAYEDYEDDDFEDDSEEGFEEFEGDDFDDESDDDFDDFEDEGDFSEEDDDYDYEDDDLEYDDFDE